MTAAHLGCMPGKAASPAPIRETSAAAINFLDRGEARMFELGEHSGL
jgi:hypothetical protein